MTHYLSDNNSYSKPDSGCEWASRVLGKQSHCLDCPFDKCFHDMSIGRRRSLGHNKRIALQLALNVRKLN